MATSKQPTQPKKRAEKPEMAKRAAEEAVHKMNHGSKEDAKHALDHATEIDKKVTNDVLKANRKSPI